MSTQYPDGQAYLATYSFEHFQKQDFWRIALIFGLSNVVVFYMGLNDLRDNFYYFFCCRKVQYNVTDRYGNDTRVFAHVFAAGQNNSRALSSSTGHVSTDGTEDDASRKLTESLLSGQGTGNGRGGGQGQGQGRARVYSGVEEELGDDRPRASSDLNKKDLSFIRTNR